MIVCGFSPQRLATVPCSRTSPPRPRLSFSQNRCKGPAARLPTTFTPCSQRTRFRRLLLRTWCWLMLPMLAAVSEETTPLRFLQAACVGPLPYTFGLTGASPVKPRGPGFLRGKALGASSISALRESREGSPSGPCRQSAPLKPTRPHCKRGQATCSTHSLRHLSGEERSCT